MGGKHLAGAPRRLPAGAYTFLLGRDRANPEKSKLKTITGAIFRAQIARVIPPLDAVVRVRGMVARKAEVTGAADRRIIRGRDYLRRAKRDSAKQSQGHDDMEVFPVRLHRPVLQDTSPALPA